MRGLVLEEELSTRTMYGAMTLYSREPVMVDKLKYSTLSTSTQESACAAW